MEHIKVEHRTGDLNLRFGQYLLECFDTWVYAIKDSDNPAIPLPFVLRFPAKKRNRIGALIAGYDYIYFS